MESIFIFVTWIWIQLSDATLSFIHTDSPAALGEVHLSSPFSYS